MGSISKHGSADSYCADGKFGDSTRVIRNRFEKLRAHYRRRTIRWPACSTSTCISSPLKFYVGDVFYSSKNPSIDRTGCDDVSHARPRIYVTSRVKFQVIAQFRADFVSRLYTSRC